MICRADVDYSLSRGPGDRAGREVIRRLLCMHCTRYSVMRGVAKRGERSGTGIYNRMRAQMIAHIHREHPDVVAVQNNSSATCTR